MKAKIVIAIAFLILGLVLGWIQGLRVGKNWTACNLPIMKMREKQQQDEIEHLKNRVESLTATITNKVTDVGKEQRAMTASLPEKTETSASSSLSERYLELDDWLGKIISFGMTEELEKLLFSDCWANIDETFPDFDEMQKEALVYSSRESALIKSARYHAFDDLLLRYYYVSAEKAGTLSSEEQIKCAAQKLFRAGPKNTRRIEDMIMADGTKGTVEYKFSNLAIKDDNAEVDYEVIPYGAKQVSLQARFSNNGRKVWIPVDSKALKVY